LSLRQHTAAKVKHLAMAAGRVLKQRKVAHLECAYKRVGLRNSTLILY
jgi:hypothetical protein